MKEADLKRALQSIEPREGFRERLEQAVRHPQKPARRLWLRPLAAAAALVMVLGAGVLVQRQLPLEETADSTEWTAAATAQPDTAETADEAMPETAEVTTEAGAAVDDGAEGEGLYLWGTVESVGETGFLFLPEGGALPQATVTFAEDCEGLSLSDLSPGARVCIRIAGEYRETVEANLVDWA